MPAQYLDGQIFVHLAVFLVGKAHAVAGGLCPRRKEQRERQKEQASQALA